MTTAPTPRNTPLALVALVAALLLPWAAAQEGGAPAPGDPAARGGIRFANLVPEGTTVDVRIDGGPAVEALAPSTVSRYVFLPPGEHTIEVTSRASLSGGGNPGAEDVEVDPEPPAAEPAAPEGAAPTQDIDPDNLRDAVLMQRTVEVRAEAYATLLLFRTPSGAATAAAEGDAAGEPPVAADREAPAATEDPVEEGAAQDAGAADEAGAAQEDGVEQDTPAEGEPGAEPPAEPTDEAAADGAADEGAASPAATADEAAGPPPLEGRLIQDPLEALPAAGTSFVRVVHAAPGIGPVTVVAARRPSDEDPPPAEGETAEGATPAGGEAAGDEAAGEEGAAEDAAPGSDAGEGAPAEPGAGEEDPAAQAAPAEGPAPIEGEALASELAADGSGAYVVVRSGPHHVQVRVQDGVVAVDLEEVVFQAGLVYTLYVAATDASDVVVVTPAVDAGVSFETR